LGCPDCLKQTILVASSILSRKDCLSAPSSSCRELNRNVCGRIANTCGECLGGYIGVAGDSNTICLSPTEFAVALNHPTSNSCLSSNNDRNCYPWQHCALETQSCQMKAQECSEQCSGHGDCRMRDINLGAFITRTCFMLDSSCSAVCICRDGWKGLECDVREEDYQSIVLLRSFLVSTLKNIYEQDDLTAESSRSYISLLNSITLSSDQLSSDTSMAVISIAFKILSDAQQSGFRYNSVSNILSSVNSAAIALSFSPPSLLQEEDNNSSLTSVMDLLVSMASRDLIHGESPINAVESMVRLSVSSFSNIGINASTGSSTFILFQPQTPIERGTNTLASSCTIRSTWKTRRLSQQEHFQMGVSMKKPILFQSHHNHTPSTDAMRLHFLDFPVDSTESIVASFNLQHYSAPLFYDNLTLPVFLNVTCENGEYTEYRQLCPTGLNTNTNITIRCEGVRTTSSRQCPQVKYKPLCIQPEELRNPSTKAEKLFHCNVTHFDAFSTTCECHLMNTNRRLNSVVAGSMTLEVR
jgi:hypothetical protein